MKDRNCRLNRSTSHTNGYLKRKKTPKYLRKRKIGGGNIRRVGNRLKIAKNRAMTIE